MKWLRRSARLHAVILAGLLPGMVLLPSSLRANPSGGTVVHGGIVIDDLTPGQLKILQSTDKAIINWQDFSIGAGELTQFIQPGADAVALNRVISGNPSSLLGTLQANGGVILVNPNGILVGAGGVVDIGGLAVLSTLDIDDQDFLDGGAMRFFGKSEAAITNLGTITSRGGDVVLLANMVDNAGAVGAPDGTVAFGAGGEFIVDTVGDSRISVVGPGAGGQTGIRNSGTVSASSVEFKAHGNVYALAIQNTGIVRANGVNRQGGRIVLSAAGNGTTGGRIENTGTLQARNVDGSGGTILIDGGQGGQVDLLGGRVDADGDGGTDGGSVTVLGDVINVTGDTRVTANGANGGFVQLGSPQSTRAVTVGPNASVSANGSTGNGGVVQVLGNASSAINVFGQVTADGAQSGGIVQMTGGTVTTHAGSVVSANGQAAGGYVNLVGSGVNVNGAVSATGANGVGGRVLVNGASVSTGAGSQIDVSGSAVGGMMSIDGANGVNVNGAVNANGVTGEGGAVLIQGNGGGVNVGGDSAIKADGAAGGGLIKIDSAANTTVNGDLSAVGQGGVGGRVDVSGDRVVIGGSAGLDASGANGGGRVRIGGGYQGADGSIRNSTSTVVEDGARVRVDSWEGGNGGNAVVWSNGSTFYRGDISAQAFGAVGNGGFVEVSGKQDLSLEGTVSTRSAGGQAGLLLIDPVDVTVGPGGGTISDAALVGLVNAGHVVIHTDGAGAAAGNISILAGANIIYDSTYSLTFLANNSIFVNGDIKNHGMSGPGGNITLVAGWDGTLPGGVGPGSPATDAVSAADFINPDGTPIVGRYGSWGKANSQIILNDANFEPVEVGSARGETNLFAESVLIKGGDAASEFSQVGYRRTSDLRDTTFFGALALPDVAPPGLGDPARPAFDAAQAAARAYATTQVVDGNINVSGKSIVALVPDPQVSAPDGDKNVNRAYTMIGHGGMREDDNDMDARGGTDFGSDSGHLSVGDGDNSGNIVVWAGDVILMQGDRQETFTQIGHGGYGDDPPNTNLDFLSFTPSALGSGVVLNLSNIIGNMSGDITLTGGSIAIEAGLYDQAYAQVGHGGIRSRGEHSGDISLTSTLADIVATGAPNLGSAGNPSNFADGAWDNTRAFSYVQVGHGGVDSDHRLALPARSLPVLQPDGTTVNGITSNPGDGITLKAAGDPLLANGASYGHTGDVSVVARGSVHFTATGDSAYAQVGHGGIQTSGDHRGDITVEAQGGDVIFDRLAIQLDDRGSDRRNVGAAAHVMIGHGGRLSNGGATGDIAVTAAGNVEFYAGRNQSFALLGHGGLGEAGAVTIGVQGAIKNADQAAGTHTGDILVDAGGDIIFRSGFGFGNLAFSQIGHGGYRNLADILGAGYGGGASAADQQGHNGDIVVTSGGDIRFDAGQVEGETLTGQEPFGIEQNIQLSFSRIGHGGYENYGDHWGNVTVTAAGDAVFEARGGWNGVTIEGADAGPADPAAAAANARGTPRFGSNEDNGATGIFNFVQVGHGGFAGEHRLLSALVPQLGNGVLTGGAPVGVAASAATDIFTTVVPHGFTGGEQVALQNIAGGGGLANNTIYFVLNNANLTSNRFQLSTTLGGAPINVTSDLQFQTQSSSGKLGDGMGTFGPSDISLTAGGDVIMRAAQADKVGEKPRIQVIRDTPVGIDPIVYRDLLGNVVALDDRYTIAGFAPSIINRANGDRWFLPGTSETDSTTEAVMVAQDSFAMIGHGGRSTNFTNGGITSSTANRGDGLGHTGNISITAGGAVIAEGTDIDVQLGTNQTVAIQVDSDPDGAAGAGVRDGVIDRSFLVGPGMPFEDSIGGLGTSAAFQGQNQFSILGRNFAQIGNGGWSSRGDHSGDITIVAGADGAGDGLRVVGGEDAQSFAQIGHGGYDSEGYDPSGNINNDNFRLNDTGSRGAIHITVAGDVSVLGGGLNDHVMGAPGTLTANMGDGDQIVLLNDNASFSYAQIGNGGYANGGSHVGDIYLQSTDGGVVVRGGKSARFSYAQVGNGGAGARGQSHSGKIEVLAEDDIVVEGGDPIRDTEQSRAESDLVVAANFGHISHGVANSGQIGHGGWDADPQGGNLDLSVASVGGHTGDIFVTSFNGTVRVEAGGDPTISINDDQLNRGNSAHIGNGGNFTDGNHSGEIRVSAGENVEIIGGGGSRDGFSMIGHGGHQIDGNLSGTIEVIAGGDLIMNRGADTDTSTANAPTNGYWAVRRSTDAAGGAFSTTAIRYGTTFDNRFRFNVAGNAATDTFTTTFANGLADGDRVMFTGAIVGGTGGANPVAVNTPYFVVNAIPGSNSFQLSLTAGGAPIDFGANLTINANNIANGGLQKTVAFTGDAATDLITLGGAGVHNLVSGDRIRFTNGFVGGGGGGIDPNVRYFVRDVSADGTSFRISTTNGGAAVNITSSFAGNDDYAAYDAVGTVFRTTRSGTEIFNNWAKIGHGDQVLRQRTSGIGTRNGDILVSVGNDVVLSDPSRRPTFAGTGSAYTRADRDQVLIGHIDPVTGNSNAFRSVTGDTFVAASRTNPYDDGTGALRIFSDAVLTSAGAGFFGDLRLYVPTPALNFIQDGAYLNSADYTRTPTPDGTRDDELPGTDHTQTLTGPYGDLDGQFIPEGIYAPSSFGIYNIYYGETNPVVPPEPEPEPGGGGGFFPPVVPEPVLPPVIPPFDFTPYLFNDKYDSFDRDDEFAAGEFFYNLFSIFGLISNERYAYLLASEEIRVEGDEILEDEPGLFGLGPAQTEEEAEEEERKSGRFLKRPHLPFGLFWTYDITTGEYSSYRVFGVPASALR